MAIGFSGGRSRSGRSEPPTMGKQLVNFIICGRVEYTLFVIYKAQRKPKDLNMIGKYLLWSPMPKGVIENKRLNCYEIFLTTNVSHH